MKKSLFLIPALALALASCSNDDPIAGSETGSEGNFETNYLSVNLVQASDMSSRAEETGYEGTDYEGGVGNENKVSKVRFYFFDAGGNAAGVKKVGEKFVNYFDWTKTENSDPNTSAGDDKPNVEKKLQAVIIINTQEGDKLPAKVVAILNPDVLSLGSSNLSLTALQSDNYEKDYVSYTNGNTPVFVMSNSVYADADKQNAIVATDIPTTHYANSAAKAEANPVSIYVERAVAKVRTYIGEQNADKIHSDYDSQSGYFTLKDKEGKLIKVDEKQVYLKLDEWNLTADTDKGNLFKNITPSSWTSIFGEQPWNVTDYHRSFWANNASKATQSWHTYSAIADGKELGKANVIYANENAPQEVYNDNYGDSFNAYKFTKVIMSGTLYIDGDNNVKNKVTLCKYAGLLYNGEDKLIEGIINSLGANMIYKGADKEPLSVDDVVFKTAIDTKQAQDGEPNQGRYNVYLQLNTTKEEDWYKSDKTTKFENNAAVNDYLINTVGKAQVYKGGQTYYYFPIKHMGDENQVGEYGVVRNHIYDCKITTLTGLGTPVYNPNEPIYPEKPQDDDTFIAAQINILSWRLVTQDVDLNW